LSSKDDKSTKRDRSGSVLKKSTFAMSTPVASTSAKEYHYEHVFYEAGLELKGEDKYGTYQEPLGKHPIGWPLCNYARGGWGGGAKSLGSKTKMSTNMTVFLAHSPVGSNANAFKPKKNNNKKWGCKGKGNPNTLHPSVYPTLVFLSDIDPNIIILCVAHEFCHTGGFYFQKKQLQCMETVSPFVIYYLYTFNDIATLWADLCVCFWPLVTDEVL
jgi:hypothetical protein